MICQQWLQQIMERALFQAPDIEPAQTCQTLNQNLLFVKLQQQLQLAKAMEERQQIKVSCLPLELLFSLRGIPFLILTHRPGVISAHLIRQPVWARIYRYQS